LDCHSAGPSDCSVASCQLPSMLLSSRCRATSRALANNQRGQSEWKLRPRPRRPHCGMPPRPRAPTRPRPRAHVRVPCELKSPPAPAPCTLAPHAPEHAPGSPRVSCRCSGGPRDESETAGLRNNRRVARGMLQVCRYVFDRNASNNCDPHWLFLAPTMWMC
jgi:hypothetical protein